MKLLRTLLFGLALFCVATSSCGGDVAPDQGQGGDGEGDGDGGGTGGGTGGGEQGPECTSEQFECGDVCVQANTATDCGGCGIACAADELCSLGTCVPVEEGCPNGLLVCNAFCVDPSNNSTHCGGCGFSCPIGSVCSAGACQCQPSLSACSGACVNFMEDPLNCGSCGAPCSAGQFCQQGVCVEGGSGGASTGGAGSGGGSTGGSDPGTGGSPEPDPGCGSHKWACWPMPNPAASGLPNPASYTDQGNGTVLDNVTGLVWQDVDLPSSGTQAEALAYCDGLTLGGYDDWRLPTRIEMTSVLDYSRPGWSSDAFSSTPGAFHHTGSDWILTIEQIGAGAGTDFIWAFNMSDGIVSNAYSAANDAGYRCVRSDGAGEAHDEPAVEPTGHYTEVAAGEVLDNYTGLIWEAGDSDEIDHAGAVSYCASLTLGGNSWRLPSIRELATLVDEAEVAPSINATYFPDTKYGSRSNNWYWASDEDAQSSADWALNFDDGFTGTNKGSSGSWNYFTGGYARCVR